MIDYGINTIKKGTEWINVWGYIFKRDMDGETEKIKDIHLRLPLTITDQNIHLKFQTLAEIIKKAYVI